MRRGQTRPTSATPGDVDAAGNDATLHFSKRELLEACDLSAKTFDTIRKAARIKGPGHGGLNWPFSVSDVIALIKRAESGQWSERGAPAAAAWRRLLGESGIEAPSDD